MRAAGPVARRRPDAHAITPPSPTRDGVPEKSPSTRWAEVARTVLASNGIVVEDAVPLPQPGSPPVVYVAAHAFAKGGRVSPESPQQRPDTQADVRAGHSSPAPLGS